MGWMNRTAGSTGSWKADPRWAMPCLAYNVHAQLVASRVTVTGRLLRFEG